MYAKYSYLQEYPTRINSVVSRRLIIIMQIDSADTCMIQTVYLLRRFDNYSQLKFCVYHTDYIYNGTPPDWLDEVGHRRPLGHRSVIVMYLSEDSEVSLEVLTEVEDSSHVATPVAVVGRRPDSDKVAVGKVVLVTFVDKLVGTAD